MKRLFVVLAALLLSLLSSYAMAQDIWVKRPNFSNVEFEPDQLCYDIDMAYFNDCEPRMFHINALLHANEQGKITHVKGIDTGHKDLDRHIIRVLRTAQIKPFMKDGMPVSGAMPLPINLQFYKVDKSHIGNNEIDLLRDICTKDDRCDLNELENALKKYGEKLRQNCQAVFGRDDCVPLDLALKEKGL